MEAISNAGSAIGVLAADGVVLAAEKRITSKVGGGRWVVDRVAATAAAAAARRAHRPTPPLLL